MTSGETIHKAAEVVDGILSADPQVAREMFGDEPDRIARALAEAGLLAPSALREEWGSELQGARPESSSHVLRARDPDNARWQVEHNPELATGRLVRRYVTDWEEA